MGVNNILCGWCNKFVDDWHYHINNICPKKDEYKRWDCNYNRQNLNKEPDCEHCNNRFRCYTQLEDTRILFI